MANEKETRERLIACAKSEFLQKGFLKASLRKICGDAGVTTGALYFFFQDKEDLFGAIVEKPLSELMELIRRHLAEDEHTINKPYEHEEGDHDEFVELIVPHIYRYYDEFLLLITKSQGTKYENCVDELIDEVEQFFLSLMEQMKVHYGGKVNKKMLHWMVHMITDAFIHMITHEREEKKAMAHIKKVMEFAMTGWTAAVLDK